MNQTPKNTIITKQALIDKINSWGQQHISTELLQLWMLDNFEPDEFDIGKGEPECVVEAMHIIMNEFELAQQEKCLSSKYQLAIHFIDCNDDNFIMRKNEFLKHGFSD